MDARSQRGERLPAAVAVAILVAGLLVAAPGGAQEVRRIEWLDLEFPPFFIDQGPDRGQGIADRICDLIRQEMAGWTHTRTVSSLVDTMRRMRAGEQVCSGAMLKTEERERFLTFSIPDMLLPPNGITVRRADLEKFGGGGEVSLARLLEAGELKLAVVQGRAYGPDVDPLLERYRSAGYVYSQVGTDIYTSIFGMLQQGSVDYIIGYPYEALYAARRAGVGGQVVSLPIAENRRPTLAHVICPKTAWGTAAIAEIDAAIRRLRGRAEYRQAIERWLDEGLRPDFERRYEAWISSDGTAPSAPPPDGR